MKIIEVKFLTPTEVPEILVLDQICLGGLWTAEAYLREIKSPNSSLLILRLWDNKYDPQSKSTVIGMACLWSIVEEAHITLLGIHPDYRQQGLGRLLLFTLLENAIARQLEWATLEVNEKNIAAINLYQKYGFEVVGKRKGYYQPAGDDALVLWLKGIHQPEFQSSLAQWQRELSNILGKNAYYLKQIEIC